MSRRYGWVGPGPTDWNAPHYAMATRAMVDHVDRLSIGIPIRDQMDEGCCTGFGISRAIQTATRCGTLSPQFAYFNGRVLEATQDVDSGAIIADVIAGINDRGLCSEDVYPYLTAQFAQRPSLDAYVDAKQNTPLFGAARVLSLTTLKGALAAGHPVVFGFSVPQYFESAEVARTGVMRLPTTRDTMVGGHCVIADGFDDRVTEPFIWCANSWSESWGISGWFKMPQRWFTDSRRLWDDGWGVAA